MGWLYPHTAYRGLYFYQAICHAKLLVPFPQLLSRYRYLEVTLGLSGIKPFAHLNYLWVSHNGLLSSIEPFDFSRLRLAQQRYLDSLAEIQAVLYRQG